MDMDFYPNQLGSYMDHSSNGANLGANQGINYNPNPPGCGISALSSRQQLARYHSAPTSALEGLLLFDDDDDDDDADDAAVAADDADDPCSDGDGELALLRDQDLLAIADSSELSKLLSDGISSFAALIDPNPNPNPNLKLSPSPPPNYPPQLQQMQARNAHQTAANPKLQIQDRSIQDRLNAQMARFSASSSSSSSSSVAASASATAAASSSNHSPALSAISEQDPITGAEIDDEEEQYRFISSPIPRKKNLASAIAKEKLQAGNAQYHGPSPSHSPIPSLNPNPNPNPNFSPSPIPSLNPNPNPNPNFSPSPIVSPYPSPNPNFSPSPNPNPNPNFIPSPIVSPNPNPNPNPNPRSSHSPALDCLRSNLYMPPPMPSSVKPSGGGGGGGLLRHSSSPAHFLSRVAMEEMAGGHGQFYHQQIIREDGAGLREMRIMQGTTARNRALGNHQQHQQQQQQHQQRKRGRGGGPMQESAAAATTAPDKNHLHQHLGQMMMSQSPPLVSDGLSPPGSCFEDTDGAVVDSVLCRARAKRGHATHPRSIAERVRRTKISDRIKKLQDLVPNLDKQANTADMLDEIVEYVKLLQQKIKDLSVDGPVCSCGRQLEPSF